MKVLGFILIIAGIVMIVFRGINIPTEKKVVDLGPVEINKKENKWFGWPTYTGAIIAVVGVFLVLGERKK